MRASVLARIHAETLQTMIRQAEAVGEVETGGRLLGTRKGNVFTIFALLPPGDDAVHHAALFEQGNEHQQNQLEWYHTYFGFRYLGDWHTHFGLSTPSRIDQETVTQILSTPKARVREILIGILNRTDNEWALHLFYASRRQKCLRPVTVKILASPPPYPITLKDTGRLPWYLRDPERFRAELRALEQDGWQPRSVPIHDDPGNALAFVLSPKQKESTFHLVLMTAPDYPRTPPQLCTLPSPEESGGAKIDSVVPTLAALLRECGTHFVTDAKCVQNRPAEPMRS